MKKYNWNVTNLYTLDEGTETDYVVNAVYNVVGTETSEGVEYEVSVKDSVKFDVIQGDTFIPYNELTNDIVVGWIQNQLGISKVNNIESCIYFAIEDKITPPIAPQDIPLPPDFG